MKKLSFVAVLIFTVAFAFGQGNMATVDQYGGDNIITVKQVGSLNYAYALEDGYNNTMWMCQTGYGNTELLYVHGNNNSIWYPQGGFFWYTPYSFQYYGFKVFTCYIYDPTNVMHQWGESNYGVVDIWGDNNKIAQTQLGYGNAALLYISGYDNFSMQYQYGSMNYSEVNITGQQGRVLTFQEGYANAALVNQGGTYNDAAIVQGGSLHSATINQHAGSFGNLAIVNQFDHSYWQPIYVGACCPSPGY